MTIRTALSLWFLAITVATAFLFLILYGVTP